MRRERPGSQPPPVPAARSRRLPDRTNGGGTGPGPADAPALPPGSTSRQAPGKDARQVEAAAGSSAYTAGKVFAEDSAILTVAGACDGTTAGFAARRTPRRRLQPDLRRTNFEGGTIPPGASPEPVVTDTRRAISWTPGPHERWRQRPGLADAPAPPPARRRGRLLEKTRGRWRRRQGAARTRRERCLRKIPRYSPLRELATARRQALPRNGPRGVGCIPYSLFPIP
jgi:hypothetical protein